MKQGKTLTDEESRKKLGGKMVYLKASSKPKVILQWNGVAKFFTPDGEEDKEHKSGWISGSPQSYKKAGYEVYKYTHNPNGLIRIC